jgi:hypothetical protein
MGVGATDTLGRVMASLGRLGEAPVRFEASMDLTSGGVLTSLPALLGNGLLTHTEELSKLPSGYYGLPSIFMLVGFMTLCRIKQPESLRYCAPGEWGKLLGLDRIPEVRTLRNKLSTLSGDQSKVAAWSAKLCGDWMDGNVQAAGVLYIDGHVRVYFGDQTELPRHYVAREKLCLRATVDYWVNAMDGQPFFLVNKPVDPGLLQVLSNDIIPRLMAEVPGQPTAEQLQADPLLHRLTVVFDREGYSPDFFLRCKQKRIACLTYHKYPQADWPGEEFAERTVQLVHAPHTSMKLAERQVLLSNGLQVREVRKLSEGGHQTAIIGTDYRSEIIAVAAQMFSRWSQENFFRYMREHFNLDRLVDYKTSALDETIQVVNPRWRSLDAQVRSKVSILNRKNAQYGAMQLEGEIDPERVERYQHDKAQLLQQIVPLKAEIEQLKKERKDTAHHIRVADLPADQRFNQLSTKTRDLVDTIKMIAYRAETAMAYIVREKMTRPDDARTLLRQVYETETDLLPNYQERTLTVRLHHMANRAHDAVVSHLCDKLNETATTFPGTDLRLIYKIGSE